MSQKIAIRLTGRELPALTRPAVLGSASRAVGEPTPDNVFLPARYVEVKAAFDVGSAARSAGDSALLDRALDADEVLIIELADGLTLITSGTRMKAALLRNRPALIAPDGAILFEKLRTEDGEARGIVGDAVTSLVSKVFELAIGNGGVQDEIIKLARARLAELLGDKAEEILGPNLELGVSWLGTKALMWAVEQKLERPAGKLYAWAGGELADADGLAEAALKLKPMLVFIHGTGSSTLGSFSDLQRADGGLWDALKLAYPGGVYGFEHRTLSESPIENALELVAALPQGACVSFVTHSRGGLVGDLMCLTDIGDRISSYSFAFEGVGAIEPVDDTPGARNIETGRVLKEMSDQHAEHRKDLARLAAALKDKRLAIDRYVRVASPAQGTKLASGNFDVFLSGILSLIGAVPALVGNPLYSAFKRVVIEIAKNRTNAHLVPGIEAMLPDSPMAALLRDATVQPNLRMAVIAGDIDGGNLLARIGVLLTDFLLFDNVDNDLVVDTQAMLGGTAAKAQARVLFDRGAAVSHFRYFANQGTRAALRSWLLDAKPEDSLAFAPLPSRFESLDAIGIKARSAGAPAVDLPVVVVLPGIMGSHLAAKGGDRIWFDVVDLARGQLSKIAWGEPDVEATGIFEMSYGKMAARLSRSHRVETFAYDWRLPLDVLGERLGEFIDRILKGTAQPVRLLAHSMGGLVVRACIYRRRAVMDALMQRDGARLVMMGTPNQGAHSMVENLLGKGDTLRMLVRLDLAHDMQEVLDIVAGFRGALQLLPKPGFIDTFEGTAEGGQPYDEHPYWEAPTWQGFRTQNTDLWFGDGHAGGPDQTTLNQAGWLWQQDGNSQPALPGSYADKSIYVFGVAPNTPCGLRFDAAAKPPRLRMVGTALGDGTVTWASGRIGGVGSYYYMPGVVHGSLLSTEAHFDAVDDLLLRGATSALPTTQPVAREFAQPRPITYDPAPPGAVDAASLENAFAGGSAAPRLQARSSRRLDVRVLAMDLRFARNPIMVGHYDRDPIAGPQHIIDTELLDGELTHQHQLGLYAGPLGTATVVLRGQGSAGPDGWQHGAVVTGLGQMDGSLGLENLRLAARTGVLRFLLHHVDVYGRTERELSLASLLLGYNSVANMTIAGSLEALVRGVIEANTRFHDATGLNISVARLDIIEMYLDTAISAAYELRNTARKLADYAGRNDTMLLGAAQLCQKEGARHRLLDQSSATYWPRLIVSDADEADDGSLRPLAEPPCVQPVSGSAPRARLANRLRYLYVGQRARAESVVRQRQPALIESLVRQQIGNTAWSPDFGRMLFQLIVPYDFKQAARDLQRVVLVLDSATANLPWELMLADSLVQDARLGESVGLPLAVQVPVVRQLTSRSFRAQVRYTVARTALVVGNPSVAGFADHFRTAANPKLEDPRALAGAEQEALTISAMLSRAMFTVGQVIGADFSASDVLAALYKQPYRVLHISAHGIFNMCHADGQLHSGIVLSDGVLITAAEIESMEFVPEMVFLNCCHLGQVDGTVRDGNRLAASIARELIDIGVRCVVVAGWAVDDALAQFFGERFYENMLNRGMPFGDAVFEARQAVWGKNPRDITWGAFQAYGDPMWLVDPRGDVDARRVDATAPVFVSPDELLDELARIRVDVTRKQQPQSGGSGSAAIERVKSLLAKRCPAEWLQLPGVMSVLGATWRDLDCPEEARKALLAAIQAEDRAGVVPIRDIEQLANIEARLGEKMAKAEIDAARGARDAARKAAQAAHRQARPARGSGGAGDTAGVASAAAKSTGGAARGAARAAAEADAELAAAEQRLAGAGQAGLQLVDQAIERLDTLEKMVAGAQAGGPARSQPLPMASLPHAERTALRGSAYKRKAAAFAHLLAALSASAPGRAAVAAQLKFALDESAASYARGEGTPQRPGFSAYNALNRLALQAVSAGFAGAPARRDAVDLARQCGVAVLAESGADDGPWKVVMQADAVLVEKLCSNELGARGKAGAEARAEVQNAYENLVAKLLIKPWNFDSVVYQMRLLAGFSRDACADPALGKRNADALEELAAKLRPS